MNRNIVESSRTSVSLVNDFGHRYPAYPHGDSWYAGYRSNNRVYKLKGLQIVEYCQLQNLFPYCLAPLNDDLLITDMRGREYYLIR